MAGRKVKWVCVGLVLAAAVATSFTDRTWLVDLLRQLPSDSARFGVGVLLAVGWFLPLLGAYVIRRRRGGALLANEGPAVVAALLLAALVVAWPHRYSDYADAVDRSVPGFEGGVLLGGVLFFGLCGLVILLHRKQ